MIDFSEAFRRGYWHVSFYDKDDQIGCTMSSKDVKIASRFGLGKTAEEAFSAAMGGKRRRRDAEDLA